VILPASATPPSDRIFVQLNHDQTRSMAAPTFRIEDLALHAGFRHLSSIPGITLDLRYGTPNNFVGRNLYGDLDCAWLHKEAADALEVASSVLSSTHPHLRLLVLDALRPQRVQEALWQALEGTPLTMYLAHPIAGSIHSFGMAVDVTLADAAAGELDMGTPFDDLTELSHPGLEEGFFLQGQLTESQLANRQLLRRVMTGSGYRGISTEWWHFDFGDRQQVRANYPRVL
jgi:D-alanyl-D-alanine dipeptidase